MVVHLHSFTANDTLLLLQMLVVNSLWNHICLYCPNAAHPSGMVACNQILVLIDVWYGIHPNSLELSISLLLR